MRTKEREGYIERLEVFVEHHRSRLKEMLAGARAGQASHGRYTLVGQP
ncbi:hypothetical protein ACPB9E_17815 [Streptomyces exfoliatus]